MSEHDLEISRVLPAPRAKLWRAWSDPKHLAEWWAPKPWLTDIVAFDFKPGGAFHTSMRGPNPGEVSDNPGCFLDVVPQERVVFTTQLVAGWRPSDHPFIAVTGIFTLADDAGGTRYTARALHKSAEESKRHADMGFYEGWGQCIDQLGEYAKGL